MKTQNRIYEWTSAVEKFLEEISPQSMNERWAADWLRENMTDPEKLLAEFELEVPRGVYFREIHSVLLVMPGTGLTSGIHQLFWFFVSSKKITLSLSQRDRWTEKFVEVLGSPRVRVVGSGRGLSNPDIRKRIDEHRVVVVSGSGETVDRYRSQTGTETKFKGYGEKRSIAVHDSPELTLEAVAGYGDDIMVHDGLGCLNTSTIYLRRDAYENSRESLHTLSKYVWDQLLELDVSAQNEVQKWLSGVYSDPKTLEVLGTLRVREPDAHNFRQTVGYGSVEVVVFNDSVEVLKEVGVVKSLNSSATVLSYDSEFWIQALLDSGFSRVTSVGEAQWPRVSWRHDGDSNFLWATTQMSVEG